MKEEVITCDICNGEMWGKNGSGQSLHLNRIRGLVKWWWGKSFRPEEERDIDICSFCCNLITELCRSDDVMAFRKVYDIWHNMCPADQKIFEKELLKIVKETDRY